MAAYYNEIDPFAAQWLRNLIAAGHIAPGDVDERDIRLVRPDDLRGYRQCHFFAGIGVWSYALRLAGWDDDREVWTGSCPCQPFSAAGAGQADADDRHLAPAWLRLIRERRPSVVLGEQVGAAIRVGWLDALFAEMELMHYACGAVDFPASSVGAPHIRQRLYFVADRARDGRRKECENARWQPSGNRAQGRAAGFKSSGDAGELADAERDTGGTRRAPVESAEGTGAAAAGAHAEPGRRGHAGGEPVGDAEFARLEGHAGHVHNGYEPGRHGALSARPTAEASATGELVDAWSGRRPRGESIMGESGCATREEWNTQATGIARSSAPGFWSDADWLPCIDGKARPTKPGLFPLAHGAAARVGRLRAYGNAIVAPQAAEFIRSYMEIA